MTDAAALPPDDKNWTWVIEQACPECGFDPVVFDVTTTGDALRGAAAAIASALAGSDPTVRVRADRWSRLEYACHVRDVYRICDERLRRMLEEDDPLYANWDQDATAIEDDYAAQEPTEVGAEMVAAAERLAARFDGVSGDQWSRPGRRSDGSVFTVETFARYTTHDPVHHVWDVEQLATTAIPDS